MLLIEYVGHIGLRSLSDGHLGRHLDYIKTLNDARVASVGFINYNASTTRINKEKTLKSSSRSFWFSSGLDGLAGLQIYDEPESLSNDFKI